MSLDGIMGLVWVTVVPDRRYAVGKSNVFMYFASTETLAKVISVLHNGLYKSVAIFPPVLWSPCPSSHAVWGAKMTHSCLSHMLVSTQAIGIQKNVFSSNPVHEGKCL